MKKLINGIVDFRKNSSAEYRHKFSKLAARQTPDALLVACCDSRVVPNVFASSDPGDLFVLRNIGNLVPPYRADYAEDNSVSSAIEFSIKDLNISDIIICGHSECAAMSALIENNLIANSHSSPLSTWLQHAIPSYERFKNSVFSGKENVTPCNYLSMLNVLQQLEHLKSYPLVAEKLQSNQLRIHGWWFDLTTADVYYYNTNLKEFVVINEEEAKTMLLSL
jgi:carbonic anhydrase